MEVLLVIIFIIAVIAIIWYLRKQSAQAAEQRKVDDFRQMQAKAADADRAERASLAATAAPAAPVSAEEPSAAERGRGVLQDAAATASGEDYERATGEMDAAAADLERARQDADLAAQRLAGRTDEALASIQAAASAHGGAVPGDGSHDCPPDYPVKGNLPTMRYHLPGQPSYGRTIPEVCFQSAEAAEAAGFSESGDEAGMRGRGVIVEEAIAAADAGGVPPGAVRGDGSRDCPSAYPIKGNQSSMIFHEPGSPTYQSTVPELCFSSVESARAAGFSATRF